MFANMRTLRNFFLLLKGETLQLKSREKRSLRFQDDSLESLLFLQRFCLPGRRRERALVVRFNKREKERRGGR